MNGQSITGYPSFYVPVKLDALTGRVKRDLIVNDVVTITNTGTAGAVGSTFAFAVISSSFDFYVTQVNGQNAQNALNSVYIMGGGGAGSGTSTLYSALLLPFLASTSVPSPYSVTATRDAPLLKISGPSTVSIGGLSGSSLSFTISGVREPTTANVEPY